MGDTSTPEPKCVPGYTGHIGQYRERLGKTFGRQTHKLFLDPCVIHSAIPITSPIHMVDGKDNKIFPTPRQLKMVRERESFVDAVYKHPLIPGYSGFVPNIQSQEGKRYSAAAAVGVAEHEALMRLYKCETRSLRQRDILQSGNGHFKQNAYERMAAPRYYHAPLVPVAGTSKAIKTEDCSYKPEKLAYSKFSTPHFLEDNDTDKYIMSGYAAHIPMARMRCGETNRVLTHNALCRFSDYMGRHKRNKWCCSVDLAKPEVVCPPVGHFVIYHDNSGLMPSYSGHVPGELYKFGSTYGRLTCNAKKWLEIHRCLDVLPDVANLDFKTPECGYI